jgi:hypothetical protein
MYEQDFLTLTELGFCIGKGNNILECHHYVIEENSHCKNGVLIEDCRNSIQFGQTVQLPMKTVMEIFHKNINKVDVILGHAIHHDITFLKNAKQTEILNLLATKPKFDTQKLMQHKRNLIHRNLIHVHTELNLQKICNQIYKDPTFLHNASSEFDIVRVWLRILFS